MEENIHDDKLDDYVRKSFEGHEEDPPTDMWSRVEGDLMPPTEIVAPRATYLRYGWQTLAAVVILVLFSLLVCEHLYYEEKLRAMAVKPLEQQETLSKSNALEEKTVSPSQPATNSQSTPHGPILRDPQTIGSNLEGTPNSGYSATLGDASKGQRAGMAARVWGDLNNPKSETPDMEKAQDLSDKTSATPTTAKGPISGLPPGQLTTESNAANPIIQAPLEIAFIPISNNLLEIPSLSSPALPRISIKPVREPSGWYVGVQTSLLASIEKPRTPVSRPGRPAFSSKQENSGISSIWWLKTGKRLNSRVSLESGVGYQKTSRIATHTPRFMFGDGTHSGGPLDPRRTFNYDLSTTSGTAEVSLRMEQITPGPPAPDDEPVSLKITTSERTELLRIPMLAGYRIGSGRWQGQVKVGLVGNFVLKSELDISARVSQNSRFRPVGGSEGYTVQLNPKKFFLGYWLSAGTEFKLNQRVSLLAESALVGDFPRNDPYRRPLPQRFMLGLNVGANYYF